MASSFASLMFFKFRTRRFLSLVTHVVRPSPSLRILLELLREARVVLDVGFAAWTPVPLSEHRVARLGHETRLLLPPIADEDRDRAGIDGIADDSGRRRDLLVRREARERQGGHQFIPRPPLLIVAAGQPDHAGKILGELE